MSVKINNRFTVGQCATFAGEVDNGNSGASKTIDWRQGNKQAITLTGSPDCALTFTAPTTREGSVGVANLVLRIIQGAGGSKTATWPGTVKWPGGTAPTLSTAAGAEDLIMFYFNGSDYYGAALSSPIVNSYMDGAWIVPCRYGYIKDVAELDCRVGGAALLDVTFEVVDNKTPLENSAGTFYGWSGGMSGTNNPDTITMTGDKAVTANFLSPP